VRAGRSNYPFLTQKERDNETGLDYFGARYYSPTQGRFTSVDPENYQAMGDLSAPQSWNAYTYVNNNPLVRVDPDGRGDFWEKLKNAVLWGCRCNNAELENRRKADEQQRRQELQQYSQSQGLNGYIIVSGDDGKAHAVTIDSLSRSQVVQISQTVRYLQVGIDVEGVGTINHNDALSLIGALGNVPQRARNTLEHIEKTGEPPPGYQGGRRFLNDGRGGGEVLPKTDAAGNRITYKEYDVNPSSQGVNRGAERIVRGSDGSAYYTDTHYKTFTKIQ
jgi:RHS repeat-associated protein